MVIKFNNEVDEENNGITKKEATKEFVNIFINNKLKKYLNYDELLKLLTSKLVTERVDIIIQYLCDNITFSNNNIYIYNEEINIYHKLQNNIDVDDFLTTYIIKFVEKSIEKLKESESLTIEKFYKNSFTSSKILNMIKTDLSVDNETFNNPKLGEIHFKNGYIKLKSQTFHKRKRSDYMTYCIWRDFNQPTEEKRIKIEKIINQIYPNVNDKNSVLECFGDAISGYSFKSQYNLFLLGRGSSGKSTLMKIFKLALKEMVFEFKEDTFAQNNNKVDRVLNMLMINPYIRIMWVNELKGRIDDSLFKQICEGEVHTTTLFQEGQNVVKFNALLVNTMNEFPNIKIDSGVERRIKSLEHTSRFTENKSEIDEKNNIYLVNKNLMEEIETDEELQNAFVEIICEYSSDFLNGKRYELSKNFKETKNNIIDTNDILKEYILNYLEKTEDEKDKLHIEELHDNLKLIYTNSKITKQQLLGSLKDKGLKYNCNVRKGEKRGCFINIKFKDLDKPETKYLFGKNKNPLDEGIVDDNETKLKNEIQELKKRLIELEKENEELKELNKKSKKTFTIEELENKIKEDKPIKINQQKQKRKQN